MKRKKNRKSEAVKRNRKTRRSRRHASPMKRKTNRANLAKGSKPAIRRGRKRLHVRRPTTARQYYAMSQKDQETWDAVAHVISRIRDGESLPKASKEFGIPPSTAVELGRPALRKRGGRYVATKTDRLLRIVTTLTVAGKKEIATRDSRQASLIGGHWAAVQRYLQTGDDSALLKFKETRVADASGKRHTFLTNLAELNRQASAGMLSFESMYTGGSR
jgi:hypothetical protein